LVGKSGRYAKEVDLEAPLLGETDDLAGAPPAKASWCTKKKCYMLSVFTILLLAGAGAFVALECPAGKSLECPAGKSLEKKALHMFQHATGYAPTTTSPHPKKAKRSWDDPFLISDLDSTLRPAVNTAYCISSEAIHVGSKVIVARCHPSSSASQQFLFAADSMIQLKSQPTLCISSPMGGEVSLSQCTGDPNQVWKLRDDGRFELTSKPSQCLNFVEGDISQGLLMLGSCRSSHNVFIRGGIQL
jgi:hypothetical protein